MLIIFACPLNPRSYILLSGATCWVMRRRWEHQKFLLKIFFTAVDYSAEYRDVLRGSLQSWCCACYQFLKCMKTIKAAEGFG